VLAKVVDCGLLPAAEALAKVVDCGLLPAAEALFDIRLRRTKSIVLTQDVAKVADFWLDYTGLSLLIRILIAFSIGLSETSAR
jgi:hypothetical protein